MLKFLSTLALLLTTVAIAPVASAQTTAADTAAVVAAVQGFHNAIATGNAAAAEALLADDATMLEAGGTETRAQYIADHLPADIEFEAEIKSKRSAVRATVVGDAAWAYSTSDMTGTFQGRAFDLIGTELMVLSRGPNGWRIRAISWSSRPRPKPAQ